MSVRTALIFYTQVLLSSVVFGQCIHSQAPVPCVSSCQTLGSNNLAYSGAMGIDSGLGFNAGVSNSFSGTDLSTANLQSIATSGGGLPIQSNSIRAPSGIAVASENAFEGSLNVVGELPFLSAVAFERVLPSGGSGTINYGCGNGVTAITSEAVNSAGGGFGSASMEAGGIGYGSGLSFMSLGASGVGHAGGQSCGCRLY